MFTSSSSSFAVFICCTVSKPSGCLVRVWVSPVTFGFLLSFSAVGSCFFLLLLRFGTLCINAVSILDKIGCEEASCVGSFVVFKPSFFSSIFDITSDRNKSIFKDLCNDFRCATRKQQEMRYKMRWYRFIGKGMEKGTFDQLQLRHQTQTYIVVWSWFNRSNRYLIYRSLLFSIPYWWDCHDIT